MFTKDETQLLIAAFEQYNAELCQTLATPEQLESITFSSRFLKRMDALVRRQQKFYYPLINTLAKRVACIVFSVVAAAMVTTFSVKALREPFIDFIIKTFEIFSTATVNAPPAENIEFEQKLPAYIPDGFEFVDEEKNEHYLLRTYQKEDNILSYKQNINSGSDFYIDAESIYYQKLYIRDYEAIYFEDSGWKTITLTDEVYVYIITSDLPKEELIKVAESIEFLSK